MLARFARIQFIAGDETYRSEPRVVLKAFNKRETASFAVMSRPFKFTRFLQIGTICVIRYSSDYRWSYARVVEKDENAESDYVLLIDHGNIGPHAKLENIRRLEGGSATPFTSLMNRGNLHCQKDLFGFFGAIPEEDAHIASTSLLKDNIKIAPNTNVPFPFIRNNICYVDVFTNDDPGRMLSSEAETQRIYPGKMKGGNRVPRVCQSTCSKSTDHTVRMEGVTWEETPDSNCLFLGGHVNQRKSPTKTVSPSLAAEIKSRENSFLLRDCERCLLQIRARYPGHEFRTVSPLSSTPIVNKIRS